jgi:hypothetical protein
MGISEIIGTHRHEIVKLAAQHGATNVRVFGSVAKGNATAESDVDFLVEWDYERMTDWGSAALYETLEAMLGRKVDIVSEKQLHPRVRERVLRESIAL